MEPTLMEGDRLLIVKPGGPWRRPRAGDIVVLNDPRATEHRRGWAPGRRDRAPAFVKRLARVHSDGVELAGDNRSASTDSRMFGKVALGALAGRAVYRYAPPDRVGWC